jgi:hypothetical protein
MSSSARMVSGTPLSTRGTSISSGSSRHFAAKRIRFAAKCSSQSGASFKAESRGGFSLTR